MADASAAAYLTVPHEGGRIELTPSAFLSVEPGPVLVIEFGAEYGTPAARFRHQNVLARAPRVYEFKHESPVRGKWWTAKPGVSLFFAFRREDVFFKRECGHSYPPVRIGDVEFRLNVSGGTCGGGWTDWVSNLTHAPVGMPSQKLRRLAAVALAPADVPAGYHVTPRPLTDEDRSRFIAMAARADMLPNLTAGIRILCPPGTTFAGADLSQPENALVIHRVDRRSRYVLGIGGYDSFVRVKYDQIDWVRTAELNGVALVTPESLAA